jgi:HSP20 family protein
MGEDMDRYFNRFMRGWPFRWPEMTGSPTAPRELRAFEHMPEVEVKENDEHYTVTVELPGLDEKDIKVDLKDEVLTISGEKKVENTDEKTHYSERSYGSFTRSFTMPADADGNAVAAKFAKGVLTVEIGKSANPPREGKRIEIKQG